MLEPQQTLTIQQALELAVQHHTAGRLSQAENIYQQILQNHPNQPVALHLLGVIAYQMGKNDRAVDLITHALALKPEYAEAHNNLGNVLRDLGKLEEALVSYRKAVQLKPDYAEAYNNLGNALQELGKLEEAATSCHKALALKPEYAEAHNNLGIVLKKLGQQEDALASYRKALSLKPDYADAQYNLGTALKDLDQLEEAVASYHKALNLEPDLAEAWNNLRLVAKALQFSEAQKGRKGSPYEIELSDTARATADFAMLEYYLDSFRPHESDDSAKKATAALPSKIEEEVPVDENNQGSTVLPQLPEKVIGLLHFGRSGTGLLHSLIDDHPEVSTLPSIYLRGFFNAGIWSKLSAKGWRELPERFADEFAVLFDANSPKSTPGKVGEDSPFLGQKEGMTTVGENRDESLSLDRDQFCAEASRLMKHFKVVDPKSFLLIVHAAFEKVLGTKTSKHTVFYHFHNPDDFGKLNFLRHAPDARLVMMVREPVQCCESWVRSRFEDNDYKNVAYRIISMLFAIDQVAFRMLDSVGVRLEDLKMKPEATLRSLCAWLGIKEAPSLYQMTAQGKKWWGDPTSPDYDKNKAMSPFGESPGKRPVGTIFSQKDRFILGTLFYPLSVRFGYRKPDPVAFEKDLKEIRPLFDGLLDFEKVMSEKSKIDRDQFKRRGDYLLLRASFMDRWNVLNEFKDYPHLLAPLQITMN